MTNRIPEEVVEQVRRSVDIVDVIGEYVQLRKQGRNYFGLCPFHGESTPSFSVSADKQIFHCFGCGEGGNSLSFLMKMDGISFTEAVKKLGERTGVDVTQYISEQDGMLEQPQADYTSSMIEAHELLKKYYHHLLVNTKEGNEAFQYLLDRGISREIMLRFEIGYASSSRDHAAKVLQKRGFSLPLMEQAGLVAQSEQDGSYYDRFRNRIMFPIQNMQGKTVAFSGRAIGHDNPKYLNSPETPVFQKSKLLYNFHYARPSIRKQQRVLLFEGYADVLAAIRSGFEESVATMGTALTEEQAKILRRNTETVVLCYDGDKAGQEATEKAGRVLMNIGSQVRVVMLPDKLDPDEYVRTYGEAAFQNLVENSGSFIDFKLQHLRFGRNLQDPQEQGEYVQAAVRELGRLTTFVQAQPYLQLLAKEFPYHIEDLRNELRQLQQVQQKKERHTIEQTAQPVKAKPRFAGYERAERELIYHMLQSEEVAQRVQPFIEYFHTEEHKGILYELYAYYEKGCEPDISHFLNWLSNEPLKNIVADLATDEMINTEYSEELLQGNLESLYKHKQKIEQMNHVFELRNLERTDPLAAARFAQEHIINKRKAKQ